MNYLLEFLPDPYLRAMADYFARRAAALPAARRRRRQQRRSWRVEKCWRRRAIPPMKFRPARTVMGRPSPAWSRPIPGLLGLRTNYISAQLGAWRYGTRTAAAPDCMQIVAGHLTRGRRQGLGRVAFVAPGALQPACRCRTDHYRCRCRAAANQTEGRAMIGPQSPKDCVATAVGSLAVFASWQRLQHRPRTNSRRQDIHRRPRRISRPGRRLRRLPHRAGRQIIRGRPRHADAIRHAIHLERHARSATPASANGPPTSSIRLIHTGGSRTAACCIRRCRSAPTPRSPGPTATRSSRSCNPSRR